MVQRQVDNYRKSESKMASSRIFCVVVLLWYSTQLPTVLAGENLVSKPLDRWVEDPASLGQVLEKWSYNRRNKSLVTKFLTNGASWFITPLLNLPNTSYLEIEASCNNSPCQFEIYGTNGHSLARSLRNFEFIQNVTFETRSMKTATIRKSFPHLRILARTTNTVSKTEFYIYSIKIRHYFCERTTIYNGGLSQVYSSTTNISQLVQCPDNALTIDGKSTNITVQCTPKGNWTFGDLKCFCDKGFFSSNQTGCSRCLTDYYKTTIGNERCQKCPDGRTNNPMHTQCQCQEDHYIGDDEDGSCYALPSEVYDLKIQTMTITSVYLSWKEPMSDGGFATIRYTVECYHCTSESKCDTIVEDSMFFPAKTNLNTTSVAVFGLIFNEKYKFKVISMNSLKNVPGSKWKFVEKMAVIEKTTQSNSETKGKCEEKASNSVVMFFTGAGTALVIVLFIIIVIQIYKRHMKTSKESTDIHAVGTVEMQVQSPAETQATQSQTNQGYVSSIDEAITPYEEVSPPPVYTESNRNQQDAATVDNTYQKLLKYDSGYALPPHGELETSYEDVESNKAPSNYQELDGTKRVLDDSASYQKLISFQRSVPM